MDHGREPHLARCVAAYIEAWRQFARMLGRGVIEEADGVTFISTGLRDPHFNPVFITAAPEDPVGALARGRSFYERLGMPWEIAVLGAEAAPFERTAEAAGLEHIASNPAMILAPLSGGSGGSGVSGVPDVSGDTDDAPGLSMQLVEDAVTLRLYNDLLSQGFSMDRALLKPLDNPSLLHTLDMARYIGYSDGEPAATSMRVTANRVAVLFNVVTLPAYRGRGFGAAITKRSALDGRGEGCIASVLQATIMGFPVYRRIGYRHVADFRMWQPRGA